MSSSTGRSTSVRAVRTEHRCKSVGYAVVEDDRKGASTAKSRERTGHLARPAYSKLHRGEPVELDDGRVVEPEEVVGPARPGRTLVYTGDTEPTDAVVAASEDADLLIHDATFAEDRRDRAQATAHPRPNRPPRWPSGPAPDGSRSRTSRPATAATPRHLPTRPLMRSRARASSPGTARNSKFPIPTRNEGAGSRVSPSVTSAVHSQSAS